MSEVSKEPFKQPQVSGADRANGRRRTQRRPQARVGKTNAASACAEAAFWARLEDREEGRLAIEADHLFDTNCSWAA